VRRREFLKAAAIGAVTAGAATTGFGSASTAEGTGAAAGPLQPPAKGHIPVAFLLSEGATIIDFAGPWEVFQDVHVESRGSSMDEQMPFSLYTVAEKKSPIECSGGMWVVPNHTFESAPAPRVVVIPAQGGRSEALMSWVKKVSGSADVVMSVCTGAFVLARAGLLNGRAATTHHLFQDRLASQYSDVQVKRGLRFVEGPKISTAGGLTSGIDLALRVVERYFGRAVATRTAEYMEYQSRSWMV
jgi:transcriptional regulator GlxA family with amidase domain